MIFVATRKRRPTQIFLAYNVMFLLTFDVFEFLSTRNSRLTDYLFNILIFLKMLRVGFELATFRVCALTSSEIRAHNCETLRWSSNTGIAADLLMVFTYEFAGTAGAVALACYSLFVTCRSNSMLEVLIY